MKIIEPNPVSESEVVERTRSDLDLLAVQPSDRVERPCRGCKIPCNCSMESPSCTCQCSSACPDAPGQLSSDPGRYPIEAGVVPVVYGLNMIRVMQPCWSCQGHMRNDGSIARVPQVWFHADSITYPQLLLGLLDEMKLAGELKQSWTISLCSLKASVVGSTFKLAPAAEFGDEIDAATFKQLQQDLLLIGDVLADRLKARAIRERRNLD